MGASWPEIWRAFFCLQIPKHLSWISDPLARPTFRLPAQCSTVTQLDSARLDSTWHHSTPNSDANLATWFRLALASSLTASSATQKDRLAANDQCLFRVKSCRICLSASDALWKRLILELGKALQRLPTTPISTIRRRNIPIRLTPIGKPPSGLITSSQQWRLRLCCSLGRPTRRPLHIPPIHHTPPAWGRRLSRGGISPTIRKPPPDNPSRVSRKSSQRRRPSTPLRQPPSLRPRSTAASHRPSPDHQGHHDRMLKLRNMRHRQGLSPDPLTVPGASRCQHMASRLELPSTFVRLCLPFLTGGQVRP